MWASFGHWQALEMCACAHDLRVQALRVAAAMLGIEKTKATKKSANRMCQVLAFLQLGRPQTCHECAHVASLCVAQTVLLKHGVSCILSRPWCFH